MGKVERRVKESVFRDSAQFIHRILYEFTEIVEQTEKNLLSDKEDVIQQERKYQAIVKRTDYEFMLEKYPLQRKNLTFDQFIDVLRPIMMGTYHVNELRHAFRLLDRNSSGCIEIEELTCFLPIVDSNFTRGKILAYVGKVDTDQDQKLNLEEFSDMISRGIGRDIIMGHI
jgi:Ca2+-binding EF-hand superfamily protein